MRIILTLIVLAIFIIFLLSMLRGWRQRQRRQEKVLAPFPVPPAAIGEPELLPELTGMYFGTTFAGNWQDRIAVGDIGHRAEATLHATSQGVLVDRVGSSPLWIPAALIKDSRVSPGLANKVIPGKGLLVITWQHGDQLLDTGFRGDDGDVYEQWVTTTRNLKGLKK
ncbi:transporter [Pseudonocardiaceae bacterium YIM PH 21723]|nr:transporter [Pseudonocardiaceae bacterium YIM PH 21723]